MHNRVRSASGSPFCQARRAAGPVPGMDRSVSVIFSPRRHRLTPRLFKRNLSQMTSKIRTFGRTCDRFEEILPSPLPVAQSCILPGLQQKASRRRLFIRDLSLFSGWRQAKSLLCRQAVTSSTGSLPLRDGPPGLPPCGPGALCLHLLLQMAQTIARRRVLPAQGGIIRDHAGPSPVVGD